MKTSFLIPSDLSQAEVVSLLDLTAEMKASPQGYRDVLAHRNVALLFQKSSTRTRTALETGIAELGGHPVYMDWSTTNFTKGELRDEAMCLGTYVDAIAARVFAHEDLVCLAAHSGVPVVNALSDAHHPTQVLADLFTMREHFGRLTGLRVAFIGDGNNVACSLIEFACGLNFHVALACPEGYRPPDLLVQKAMALGVLELTSAPDEAANGADVLYTDAWVSLGQEAERAAREKAFAGFKIDDSLLAQADCKAVVMHCLPVYREQEISSAVLDGPRSIVRNQAANKKYAKKALLGMLLNPQRLMR